MQSNRFVLIIAILITCIAAVGGVVSARAKMVPLDRKIAESDFIGIVRILEVSPLQDPSTSDGEWTYRQLARVEVLESIKGPSAGTILALEFDNGAICPNATYVEAREYLVFFRKIGPNRYATYNYYYGQYQVDGSEVAGWNENWDQATDLKSVILRITEYLEQ